MKKRYVLLTVTAAMAEAVMNRPALKILLSLHQENVLLMDFSKEHLPHIAMTIAKKLMEILNHV